MNSGKKSEDLSRVLFILEKDDIIDYSLSTHSDLENISFFPDEKEVLFFPFSSFEIKEIKKIENINGNKFIIRLLYLGKYINEFQKENINEKDLILSNSEFKKEIIQFGLINKDTEKKGIKQLLKEYKSFKEKIDNEHEFKLSNLKERGVIDNKINIVSLTILKNKYIFVRGNFELMTEINAYSVETKSLKMKIPLKEKNENSWDFRYKRLEIYKKDEKDLNMKNILLISDIYLIKINLVDNNWKFVKILTKGKFLSNLDIIELDYKPPDSQNFETNIFNYEGNFKTKIKTLFKPEKTHEINGKFLITYTYQRLMSTTTIFDMRNNYKKVLEKSYFHHDIYGFPDKDTIVLPPNTNKFIFLNLNKFEIK